MISYYETRKNVVHNPAACLPDKGSVQQCTHTYQEIQSKKTVIENQQITCIMKTYQSYQSCFVTVHLSLQKILEVTIVISG